MSKPYDEQPDLNLVAKYFLARSLSAERFSDTEKAGKTPDFRIRQDGLLVAYCEVKAPNDPWLDEQLDDAPPLTIVGGCRPDPCLLPKKAVSSIQQLAAWPKMRVPPMLHSVKTKVRARFSLCIRRRHPRFLSLSFSYRA
jgi:hypothetical protein